MVAEEGWDDPDAMKAWLGMGKKFALSLPAK